MYLIGLDETSVEGTENLLKAQEIERILKVMEKKSQEAAPATSIPCETGHNKREKDLRDRWDLKTRVHKCLKNMRECHREGTLKRWKQLLPTETRARKQGKEENQSIVRRLGQQRETKRTTVRPGLFGNPLQDRARVFPVKGARDALRDLETGIRMADGENNDYSPLRSKKQPTEGHQTSRRQLPR